MDQPMTNPLIPAFLAHPYIQSIADKPRWTVSDNNKRPIDFVWFIRKRNGLEPSEKSQIRGASYPDDRCLVTLYELIQQLPNVANFAYYLSDAVEDGYVILDIEPSCPDDMRQWFLTTNYIYGEYSRSGRGIHLVYPIPACFQNYPDAQKKIKMQTKDKTYEFMLSGHYMTFTGNQLPPATGANTIDQVFEDLCKQQVYVEPVEVDISTMRPDIPNEDKICAQLKYLTIKKTKADYENDDSRFEFGFCKKCLIQLERIMEDRLINPNGIEYTDNQKAWLIYEYAEKHIPHRKKHDTTRKVGDADLPWLLYVASSVLAKDTRRAEQTSESGDNT